MTESKYDKLIKKVEDRYESAPYRGNLALLKSAVRTAKGPFNYYPSGSKKIPSYLTRGDKILFYLAKGDEEKKNGRYRASLDNYK